MAGLVVLNLGFASLNKLSDLFPIFIAQPSRDTASECGTGLVIGSWDDEKNTVGLA